MKSRSSSATSWILISSVIGYFALAFLIAIYPPPLWLWSLLLLLGPALATVMVARATQGGGWFLSGVEDVRTKCFFAWLAIPAVAWFVMAQQEYLFPLDVSRLLLWTVAGGLAITLAQTRALRRTGASLFIRACIAIIYMVMLGGALAVFNGRLDQSTPTTQVLRVLKMEEVRQGRKTAHWLTLAPSEANPRPEKITVKYTLFRQLKPNDLVCAQTYAGAFNLPWRRIERCESQY